MKDEIYRTTVVYLIVAVAVVIIGVAKDRGIADIIFALSVLGVGWGFVKWMVSHGGDRREL